MSKGRFRPNRPETRANPGAAQVDGKNDGKNLQNSSECLTNQQLRRLVDD
jgi:hypothetical protein